MITIQNNSFNIHLTFFQLCEGGPVIDLCRGLAMQGKKMREEHIGFILREVIKVCFTTFLCQN